MRKKQKSEVEAIALERIYRLFELAEKEFEKHSERSKRYVELARKISSKNRVRIPKELKERFCKQCGAFWKTGKNVECEKIGEMLVCRCLECKAVKKIDLRKK